MSLWHVREHMRASAAAKAVNFDPLRVPPGVRERLATALPAREFLLFRGNPRTGLTCAVSNSGARPYHICLPRWTPFWQSRVSTVAAMVSDRETAYETLSELVSRQNPACAGLPIVREVWEKFPPTLVAYDMTFPAGYTPPAEYDGGSVVVNAFIFTAGNPDPTNVILHARVKMF